MRLRTRLLAHSSAQLVVFGLIVGLGYYEVRATVVPMLEDSLRMKAESSLVMLTSELEVPLGADDRSLVAKAVEATVADPDFQYLEVTDAHGAVRYRTGTPPASVARNGAPRTARLDGETVDAWGTVSIEGVKLGDVLLVYDNARVAHMSAWIRAIGTAALGLWLAILAYSIAFSRAFVRPIRSMMQFTHDVAGGQLGTRLETPAPGELAELKDDLNQMACELAEREAAQVRAAAKEAELRQELMQVSRMAGMAEVATGVLHNVGNVLNSLNVSVSVVGDRLKQSKVASLTRTVEMFGQHPEGLSGLLTTEKGKLIPQFLTSVAQRLVEENTLVRTELANVASNVDHIKAIVATQQSYAQVAGVTEPVELASLLDDALHLSEASFARHKVEVVREYGEVPTLNTDRHKLLQIVINLVSNARHALKSKGTAGKLTMRIERRGEQVAIVVADTGIGITPENLTRVFHHGFTTKKSGHGFGLHSCANAARELGGSIAGESPGHEGGATFTVLIPIDAPARTYDTRN
jgi:signal transduction histidine kinase